MNVSNSKEKILKKIRQALTTPVPVPFPHSEGSESVFQPERQENAVEFAENFTKLQGLFSYCVNGRELAAQLTGLMTTRGWKNIYCREDALKDDLSGQGFNPGYSGDLAGCDAALTTAEFLIARTGSIMLSSAQQSGRTVSVYAPVHICIAYTDQLVYDIRDALLKVRDKYGDAFPSLVTLATGPSRTADIEKTLVVGVHGPKEVYCFLVER